MCHRRKRECLSIPSSSGIRPRRRRSAQNSRSLRRAHSRSSQRTRSPLDWAVGRRLVSRDRTRFQKHQYPPKASRVPRLENRAHKKILKASHGLRPEDLPQKGPAHLRVGQRECLVGGATRRRWRQQRHPRHEVTATRQIRTDTIAGPRIAVQTITTVRRNRLRDSGPPTTRRRPRRQPLRLGPPLLVLISLRRRSTSPLTTFMATLAMCHRHRHLSQKILMPPRLMTPQTASTIGPTTLPHRHRHRHNHYHKYKHHHRHRHSR